MKYSVIVPIYNMEKYLEECIKSVLSQNRNDVELILINDGSKDDSLSICRKYEKNNYNVKIVDKSNTGSMDSWIKGVEIAKGEYIAFLDADDFLEKNYFAKIDEILIDDVDIIMFDFYRKYKTYKKEMKINVLQYGKIDYNAVQDIKNNYYRYDNVYSLYRWNKIIKSAIIKDNIKKIKYRCIYFEDHLISFLNLLSARSLYYLEESLYNYRMRKSSVSHNVNPQIFVDAINIEKEMLKILKENNYDDYQKYKMHLYFVFQYARWALKSSENVKQISIKFKDIIKIDGFEKKLTLLFYKFKMKRLFSFLNYIRHLKKEDLNEYYE